MTYMYINNLCNINISLKMFKTVFLMQLLTVNTYTLVISYEPEVGRKAKTFTQVRICYIKISAL